MLLAHPAAEAVRVRCRQGAPSNWLAADAAAALQAQLLPLLLLMPHFLLLLPCQPLQLQQPHQLCLCRSTAGVGPCHGMRLGKGPNSDRGRT